MLPPARSAPRWRHRRVTAKYRPPGSRRHSGPRSPPYPAADRPLRSPAAARSSRLLCRPCPPVSTLGRDRRCDDPAGASPWREEAARARDAAASFGPAGALPRSGLGCARAGVLISGDVIAEDTVAGLGGLSTRASARQDPEKPCSSSRCVTGSDLRQACTAADRRGIQARGQRLRCVQIWNSGAVWQTTISWLACMGPSPPTTTGCSTATKAWLHYANFTYASLQHARFAGALARGGSRCLASTTPGGGSFCSPGDRSQGAERACLRARPADGAPPHPAARHHSRGSWCQPGQC